jgi:hypothetical protein
MLSDSASERHWSPPRARSRRRQLGPLLEMRQAQELLGVGCRQAVHDLIQRHRLLALHAEDRRKLIPLFQFSESGRPYEAIPIVLRFLPRRRRQAGPSRPGSPRRMWIWRDRPRSPGSAMVEIETWSWTPLAPQLRPSAGEAE